MRAKRIDEAVSVASSAIPLCLERGNSQLAADVFMEMRSQLGEFELDTEQLLVIAGALLRKEEWAAAAKAYSKVVDGDGGEIRAVEGLLQVAEGILEKKGHPPAAARVYRYLMARCSTSPLAERIKRGLEKAERGIPQPAS
jgi:hypothetical protein